MNILIKIFLGILVSLYLFPVGFSFLPPSVNSKMILAVLGSILFLVNNVKLTELKINYQVVFSIFIASIFSLISFYSTDYNITTDYSYSTYIVSFFVWLSGAYSISSLFRVFYKEFTFRDLSLYLVAVCTIQCFLALMIDKIPTVQILVDSVFVQGQDFMREVDRLYGIGASLDPAGVRFSVVLIITANLLINDQDVRTNKLTYFFVLLCFFIIGVIGNMISRTTIIGFGMGFFYIVLFSDIFRVNIKYNSLQSALIFMFILAVIIFVSLYIYNNSEDYRESMRFAFEGFFNWYEKGEWRTSSTDKLNNEMWVWPQDTKTWIIGSGHFDNYYYSTDIGYCRFILYSGLLGFGTFAFLFVYNSLLFMYKVPTYRIMFFLFGVLQFIIWVKVATDIFFIYALLYCVDSFGNNKLQKLIMKDENSL